MQVLRWPGEALSAGAASAVTLGVFDGVHLGHQVLIARVTGSPVAASGRSVVVTFDRHPSAVLRGGPEPAITSLDHRVSLFRAAGLDLCVVIGFCDQVAAMPAEEFARQVFGDLLQTRLLVIGTDCRFGKGGEGGVELCRRLGPELGFDVEVVGPVEVEGRRISSTAIREAIVEGDLDLAARLLGRPVSLYGTVVHGDGRGRDLGYPTANLDPHNETIPPDGVYAGCLTGDGGRAPAVISIGRRPTFRKGDAGRVVEVHVIGVSADLYGRDIEVQFSQKLREQRAFGSADDLVAQIERDVAVAGKLCAERGRRG